MNRLVDCNHIVCPHRLSARESGSVWKYAWDTLSCQNVLQRQYDNWKLMNGFGVTSLKTTYCDIRQILFLNMIKWCRKFDSKCLRCLVTAVHFLSKSALKSLKALLHYVCIFSPGINICLFLLEIRVKISESTFALHIFYVCIFSPGINICLFLLEIPLLTFHNLLGISLHTCQTLLGWSFHQATE